MEAGSQSMGTWFQEANWIPNCASSAAERGSRWVGTYTIALRTSSRGMTPSFSAGKSSFVSAKSWKTSFISFSSSAVMSFSFASLERVRFGAAVDELAGAPRLLGGCGRMLVGGLLG